MPALFPVFMELGGRRAVLVGGGEVAARKLRALAASGARVVVVAPRLCPAMERAAAEVGAEILRREYRPGDLDGAWFAVAATDDEAVNRRVAADAGRLRIFCNVADAPELCTCQMPAVLRRGLLQIAVSTGGASPALAVRIRDELAARYGESYGVLLDGLMELRRHLKRKYPGQAGLRRRLLTEFLDSDSPRTLLGGGDREEFLSALERWKSR